MNLPRAWLSSCKRLQVSVHTTPCIVSHPLGGADSCALVNPTNNHLVGTELPYFPVGGPVPKKPPRDIARRNWGGMDIGQIY